MPIIKKYMRRQKGFMLTEVLITALLIVITMVGVVPILFSGMKAVKVSKSRAIGMNIVQKEIESFNQDKFANVYDYIKLNVSPAIDFDSKFKEGSGIINSINDNNSGVYIEFLPDFYINTINGTLSNNPKPGYKRATLTKKYSFLKGETEVDPISGLPVIDIYGFPTDKTITDDAIQLFVSLDINGERTLKMTSILSRDKIN